MEDNFVSLELVTNVKFEVRVKVVERAAAMEISTASVASGEEAMLITEERIFQREIELSNINEASFEIGPAAAAAVASDYSSEEETGNSFVELREISPPTVVSDPEKYDENPEVTLTDKEDEEEEDEETVIRRKILDEKEEVKALQLKIRHLRERLLEQNNSEGSSEFYAADSKGAGTSPQLIRSPSPLSECGYSLLGIRSEPPTTRNRENSSTASSGGGVSAIEADEATELAGNRRLHDSQVRWTEMMNCCNDEIIKSLRSNIIDIAKLHLKRYEAVETEVSDTRRDLELCRSKQAKLADKLCSLRSSLCELITKYERMNQFERNMEANLKKSQVRLNVERTEENCDNAEQDDADGRRDDCGGEKSIRIAMENLNSMRSLKSITVRIARSCMTQCEQLERELEAAKDYLDYCRMKEDKFKQQLSRITKTLGDLIGTYETLKDSSIAAFRLYRTASVPKQDGTPLAELNAC